MIKTLLTVLILTLSAMAQTGGVPGQPKPIKADQVAGNDGTNLRVLKTDTAGQLIVTSPTGTSANQVQGATAVGAAVTENPVAIGGKDNSGNKILAIFDNGALRINPFSTSASGVADASLAYGLWNPFTSGSSSYPVANMLDNDNASAALQWDKWRSARLATMPTASTLTSRNSIGAAIVEKGSRWAATSAPAAGTAASASIAAEAATRHMVDCVSWSADSSGAVTAANAVITVRDGATGAGTVLWQWVVSLPTAGALGVQEIVPVSHCGLNLVGTTNTAMTVEFSAGVANVLMTANMSGTNLF